MLKIDDALNLAPEPETTFWLGDPAIDAEASNVSQWCATGDTSALVVRAGQTPSAIRFRGLDDVELSTLRGLDESHHRVLAAAAIGVVAVDGVQTRSESYPIIGVRYLTASSQRALQSLRARFALRPALEEWSISELGRELTPGIGEADADVGLLEWLGLQVLARTFRSRGR